MQYNNECAFEEIYVCINMLIKIQDKNENTKLRACTFPLLYTYFLFFLKQSNFFILLGVALKNIFLQFLNVFFRNNILLANHVCYLKTVLTKTSFKQHIFHKKQKWKCESNYKIIFFNISFLKKHISSIRYKSITKIVNANAPYKQE